MCLCHKPFWGTLYVQHVSEHEVMEMKQATGLVLPFKAAGLPVGRDRLNAMVGNR